MLFILSILGAYMSSVLNLFERTYSSAYSGLTPSSSPCDVPVRTSNPHNTVP
jgi:hypothetical protein